MAELKLTKFKVIQVLLFVVVIVLLFFGGCGRQETDDDMARLEDMATPLSGGVNINAMGSDQWKESQDMSGMGNPGGTEGREHAGNPGEAQNPGETQNGTAPDMERNLNEASVAYREPAFMCTARAIGGDSIYTAGFLGEFSGDHPAEGPYFVGRIGIEEDQVRQFGLEIPEGMQVHRSCIDSLGRWHLLMRKKTAGAEGMETEIWVINRDGQLERSVDITECAGDGDGTSLWRAWWMTIDNAGVYYFATEDTVIAINIDDLFVKPFHFGGEIKGIGMGRLGQLYGVFNVEGSDFLGILDTESGSIEKCVDFPENNMRPSFSVLQAGVDTELFLANKGDGIWSYDGAELKQMLTLENVVGNGQDILAMGFMWDGRVCVMSYEEGKYVFHYAPVEM